MAKKDGDIFGTVMGCAVFLILGTLAVAMFLMIAISASEDPGTGASMEESGNISASMELSDEGNDYYEDHRERLDKDIMQASQNYSIPWVFLEAVYSTEITAGDKKDEETGNQGEVEAHACSSKLVGKMKLKELNWISQQYLKENPDAKTESSDCGDVKGDVPADLTDLELLEKYQNNQEAIDTCLTGQESEDPIAKPRDLFCTPFGMDADGDKKANPTDDEDAIHTAANILAQNQLIFGRDFIQTFNTMYGDDPKFLSAVKRKVLAWLKKPSDVGVFKWPVDPNKDGGKQVTKRFEKGTSSYTIKAAKNTRVYAIADGRVIEVGQNDSCGKFVKLEHNLPTGQPMRTTYCNLASISVEKDDEVTVADKDWLIDDEVLGELGDQPLVIKLFKVGAVTEQDTPDKETEIDPEQYLALPSDVTYGENEKKE